jgi:hypothetical protein
MKQQADTVHSRIPFHGFRGVFLFVPAWRKIIGKMREMGTNVLYVLCLYFEENIVCCSLTHFGMGWDKE